MFIGIATCSHVYTSVLMILLAKSWLFIVVQANAEKQRLEIKQRKARKEAEMGVPLEPRWFEKVSNAVPGETPAFVYKGGYWESRREGRWEGCRDIFSTDE